MRFKRYLAPPVLDLLLPQAPLGFLARDFRQWLPADPFALDLQLREGNVLRIYHGTTDLLRLAFDADGSSLTCSASPTYAAADGYAELMRRWLPVDWQRLEDLVPSYLIAAASRANSRYYREQADGYWHNRLSLAWGPYWKPGFPWVSIDRQVVLGFDNDEDRRSFQGPIQAKYVNLRNKLRGEDPRRWGQPGPHSFGHEMDLLGLGPSGQLVIVELKHGSDASGISWGPLQVNVYRDMLREAVRHIWPDLTMLVKQKVRLGLLPAAACERLILSAPPPVEATFVVTEPNDLSSCWSNAAEVIRRLHDADVTCYDLRDPNNLAPHFRSW